MAIENGKYGAQKGGNEAGYNTFGKLGRYSKNKHHTQRYHNAQQHFVSNDATPVKQGLQQGTKKSGCGYGSEAYGNIAGFYRPKKGYPVKRDYGAGGHNAPGTGLPVKSSLIFNKGVEEQRHKSQAHAVPHQAYGLQGNKPSQHPAKAKEKYNEVQPQ